MTDQQMRVAVAEMCGWRRLELPHPIFVKAWEHPDHPYAWREEKELPDYPNDLNAVHEAEKLMLKTEKQCAECAVALASLCKGFPYDPFHGTAGYVWHATARQRCEALLRVWGKWVE